MSLFLIDFLGFEVGCGHIKSQKAEVRKRLRRCDESRVTGGEGLKGRWKKFSWLFAGIGELLDDAVLKKS